MAFPVASFTQEQFQRLQATGETTQEINRFAANHKLAVKISLEADPLWEARFDGGRIVIWYLGEPAPAPVEELVMAGAVTNGSQPVTQLLASIAEPGADLRDVGGAGVASGPGIFEDDPFSSGLEGLPQAGLVTVAMSLLRAFMRSPGRITAATWNLLPGWAKTTLVQAGIGIGTLITIDQFTGGDTEERAGVTPMLPSPIGGEAHLDLPGIHLGAHVIGGWVANGVPFYKLSNGYIAVKKKNGTIKVYKPPKPIVLMPTGSGDLRTLLRADAVITKQAKKIRQMLDRRAPRPSRTRSSGAKSPEVVVIEGSKGTHT